MSRKVLVLKRTDAGISYGRVVKATDHMAMQDYAHAHVEAVVRDMLMKGAAAARVSGFDYAPAAGLQISVGPGHAVDALGRSFETYPEGQNAAAVFAQAHAAQPRIDLVYASLVADQDVELQPLPHRRLLTPVEIAGGADPYPAENFDVYSQRQTRAVVGVRQGVAAALPAAPALGANEVPLYHVRIEANAVALTADKVTDVRVKARSLEGAWGQIDALLAALAAQNESIDDRVAALVINSASVSRVYDDGNGTLTLNVEPEFIQDTVAAFIAAGVGIAVAYNDAGNAFTVSVSAEYVQDTVDGMLLVGAGLTKVYDDNANTLTLSVSLEYLQDQVAALLAVTANTGLSLVYDDAAGTLTLAGVAATAAAMGMMPAADKSKLDAATDAATANAIVRRDAGGDFSARRLTLAETSGGAKVSVLTLSNPGSGSATGSQIDFRMTNQLLARIAQDFDKQPENIDEGMLRFYLSRSPGFTLGEIFNLDYQNTPLGKMFGNFEVTGALSKGSGTFHIDHPLEAMRQTHFLDHGFAESAEYLLVYRGRVRLSEGRAVVNIDDHYRLTRGTFAALTQRADVHSLVNRTGFSRVRATEVEDGSFGIVCEDLTSSDEIAWCVMAERADAHIRSLRTTDDQGRMIAEYMKPEVTPERLERLTAPREEVVETGEEPEAEEREEERVVTELLGARGHLLHPGAFGVEPVKRKVRVRAVKREGRGERGGGKGSKKPI